MLQLLGLFSACTAHHLPLILKTQTSLFWHPVPSPQKVWLSCGQRPLLVSSTTSITGQSSLIRSLPQHTQLRWPESLHSAPVVPASSAWLLPTLLPAGHASSLTSDNSICLHLIAQLRHQESVLNCSYLHRTVSPLPPCGVQVSSLLSVSRILVLTSQWDYEVFEGKRLGIMFLFM